MSENKNKADMVYSCVSGKLHYINSISEMGSGKGILAQLRRGAGKKPGELPELWGMIFEKVPDELLGKNEVSYAEWAIYTALTLYAVHRQGVADRFAPYLLLLGQQAQVLRLGRTHFFSAADGASLPLERRAALFAVVFHFCPPFHSSVYFSDLPLAF